MIISGGYTYRDWRTFPVYAFPITNAERTLGGEWIDLSPAEDEVAAAADDGDDSSPSSRCRAEDDAAAREGLFREAEFLDDRDAPPPDPWERAAPCAPSGRMGHMSGVHDGRLYVFGGLIYDEELASSGGGGGGGGGGHHRKRETFRLEDVPFVYRLDLGEMLDARLAESEGGGGGGGGEGGGTPGGKKVAGWQRIVPRVRRYAAASGGGAQPSTAAEVLLSYVNRGEMQGGVWSYHPPEGPTTTGEGGMRREKLVMYGGLRISNLVYEGHGHDGHAPSKFVKGETAFGPPSSQMMLSRKIVELPLGDVWAYDFESDCWERITNGSGRVREFDMTPLRRCLLSYPNGKDGWTMSNFLIPPPPLHSIDF